MVREEGFVKKSDLDLNSALLTHKWSDGPRFSYLYFQSFGLSLKWRQNDDVDGDEPLANSSRLLRACHQLGTVLST